MGERIQSDGSILSIGHQTPFHFGISPSSSKPSFNYLFRNSLVTLIPKGNSYIISPESPHFKDDDLLEHINIVLFSATRRRLEEVATELDLPWAVKEKK